MTHSTGADRDTAGRFVKGHRRIMPYRHDVPLTIRKQRRIQAAALSRMILDMSRDVEAGKPVDRLVFTRLVHLQLRMESEL